MTQQVLESPSAMSHHNSVKLNEEMHVLKRMYY